MTIWEKIKSLTDRPTSTQPLILVGLGNPGQTYEGTRHNLGREALIFLTQQESASFLPWQTSAKFKGRLCQGKIAGREIYLLLPETYMNESGRSVESFLNYHPDGELVVVHDDIDLPLGRLKLAVGRGAGGHKGVLSLIGRLDSQDFKRIRMGIRPPEPSPLPVDKLVLAKFLPAEVEAVKQMLKGVAEAVTTLVDHGWDRTMEKVNRR